MADDIVKLRGFEARLLNLDALSQPLQAGCASDVLLEASEITAGQAGSEWILPTAEEEIIDLGRFRVRVSGVHVARTGQGQRVVITIKQMRLEQTARPELGQV